MCIHYHISFGVSLRTLARLATAKYPTGAVYSLCKRVHRASSYLLKCKVDLLINQISRHEDAAMTEPFCVCFVFSFSLHYSRIYKCLYFPTWLVPVTVIIGTNRHTYTYILWNDCSYIYLVRLYLRQACNTG